MEDERNRRQTGAMIELIVVGEGVAEETFLRDVLGPALAQQEIFVQPRLIPTSKHGRGGALSRDRVLRYLRNTLRERANVYVSTFFDLYGLDTDFPGWSEAQSIADPLAQAKTIEDRFRDAVAASAQCRPDRFLPHIQPHEFEALLFSDIDRLVAADPDWSTAADRLKSIRAEVLSPEHIDDGPRTHPSARLAEMLRPRFRKVLHGPRIAAGIGLQRIREECQHFAAWLDAIERLRAL